MKKKPHPRFRVPNLGSKSRKGVKDRWRKQRGVDNKKRIMRKGYGALPRIGYKNSDSIRNMRSDGTFGILVHNESELRDAIGESSVSIIFAHDISKRKRIEMQKIADSKGKRVVNRVRE